MSLGKRLFIGETAAAADAASETVDIFGDSSGIALYTLDYDASDESGNYDGTPTDVTFGVDGQINWGASFNGSSSKIVIGTELLTSLTAYSVSAWVNPQGASGQKSIVANYGYNGVTESGWIVSISSSDKVEVYNTASGASVAKSSTASITYDVWTHIAVTHTGSQLKIYINGSLDSTHSSTFEHSGSVTDTLTIGVWEATGTQAYYTGLIDQVRIFNKALSSDEVGTLSGETATVYTATTDTIDYQGTNIAYYKFDNNALDETSNNHDGTENSITYEFGRYGTAAVFNGSSSYISVAHNSAFNWGSNKTLSVWVKFDSVSSLSAMVSKHTVTSGNYGWSLYLASSGKIQFVQYNSGNTASTLQSDNNAVVGRWYHICVTGDGTTNKLYIDNVENDSQSAVTANNITEDLVIGRLLSNGTGYNHNGQIDQLRFYESTLNTTAIENLYNEKQAYITKNASDPFGDGDEEAFYKFDNNTNDSTGSYNMTNRNITFSTDSAIGTYSGEFNGTSAEGVISTTTTTPIDWSSEDFTVSLWVKVDSFSATGYPFSRWGTDSTLHRSFLISTRPTGYEDVSVYEHDGTNYYQMIHSQTLEADRWHHIAYTRNGSTGTVYVDGVGESFARTNSISAGGTQDIFIGNAREDTSLFFDGHIDSMRLFSRCLDGDEVFKLYAEVIN